MIRRLHELLGYRINASDGEIGTVNDFYFDDHQWTVRYMVVDSGSWLFSRRLLVATDAIESIESLSEVVNVKLTKDQVENSPDLDLAQPFTREQEIQLHDYYGWAGYWAAPPLGGVPALTPPAPVPVDPTGTAAEAYSAIEGEDTGLPSIGDDHLITPNLRRLTDVRGYYLEATDGDIGHVADFFAGEEDWTIRYMEVDTRNWLPGKHVLVGVDWVTAVKWAERKVQVKVERQQVQESPEYDPQATLDRAYESRLHEHYFFPTYWGV